MSFDPDVRVTTAAPFSATGRPGSENVIAASVQEATSGLICQPDGVDAQKAGGAAEAATGVANTAKAAPNSATTASRAVRATTVIFPPHVRAETLGHRACVAEESPRGGL